MSERARPTVVLLHGLARGSRSLSGLRKHLEAAGFPTWAHSYPSRRLAIREAAARVADRIHAELPGRELHAVTHSLGGILVRHLDDPRLRWRRIVMLAPPNRGSQVALAFRTHPFYRWFYGPAGQELADPADWPDPPASFAVIAGTRHRSWSNPTALITRAMRLFRKGEPNDGTVAVAETRLEGMAAFVTVDATHTWIMNHDATRGQVVAFLDHGRFNEAS
jgi:hypothetical protein